MCGAGFESFVQFREVYDAAAEGFGFMDVVRHKNDGGVRAARNGGDRVLLRGSVQSLERLVKQQQVRSTDKRPRKGDELLHAAREFRGQLICGVAQAEARESDGRVITVMRIGQNKPDIFFGGEPRQQPRLLKYER